MRHLFVGDPHVVPDELPDCQALVDLICETVQTHRVDRVVLLGDLHHTMSVMRVEVLQFWRQALARIHEAMPDDEARCGTDSIVALKGNHDAAQDKAATAHALLAYEDLARVVGAPWVDRGVLYMPWMADLQEFVRLCQGNPAAVLACHQEFNGAQYDNGMYIPGGVDPEAIPQVQVVAGHIHRPQRAGKVWYVGAPRWRSADDVGSDRFLEVVDIGGFQDGAAGAFHPVASVPTDTHCRRLVRAEDTPGAPWAGPAVPHWRYLVDIRGPRAWLEQRSRQWAGQALLRTYSTEVAAPRVRESEGVWAALDKYLGTYTAPHGTPGSILGPTVRGRLCLA